MATLNPERDAGSIVGLRATLMDSAGGLFVKLIERMQATEEATDTTHHMTAKGKGKVHLSEADASRHPDIKLRCCEPDEAGVECDWRGRWPAFGPGWEAHIKLVHDISDPLSEAGESARARSRVDQQKWVLKRTSKYGGDVEKTKKARAADIKKWKGKKRPLETDETAEDEEKTRKPRKRRRKAAAKSEDADDGPDMSDEEVSVLSFSERTSLECLKYDPH